jgi:type IV pilus biogenesis protein CpaD/CtpE
MKLRASQLTVAIAATLLLAGCQSKGRTFTPEPESIVLATRMHPEIKTAFDRDYIELIVKSTSAAGMERACRAFVRVRPEYRSSLALVLRTNDIEFGRGSSRKEVAEKAAAHRRANDCASLASRLNAGGYDNIFLERLR